MPDYAPYTELTWYRTTRPYYPDLTPAAGKHGFGVLDRYYALPAHFPIGPDAYGMTEVSITDPDVRADIISGFYRIYGGDFSYFRPHIAAFFRWILRPPLPEAKQAVSDQISDYHGTMLQTLYGKTSIEERDLWHILEDIANDLDSPVPEVAEAARVHLGDLATEAEHDKFRKANLENTGDAVDPAVYMANDIKEHAEMVRTKAVAALKAKRIALEEVAFAEDHDALEDLEDAMEARFIDQTAVIQAQIEMALSDEEKQETADEEPDTSEEEEPSPEEGGAAEAGEETGQ